MNFLIVVPRFVKLGFYYDFPLGLAYISRNLKDAGHQVDCLNLNSSNNTVTCLLNYKIKNTNPDVFCIGGLSPHYPDISIILQDVRLIKPGIKIIIGGGIVTSEPEMIMEMLDADIGVLGEGDQTIKEVANALSNGGNLIDIPGIVYRENGKARITEKRKPIKDIDSLPYPDYESFNVRSYLDMQSPNDVDSFNFFDDPRVLPIVASRGCPYLCTFCFSPLGKQYRQHSLDYIFKYIEYLIETYEINGVFMLDELFSTKKSQKRLIRFCERIKEYDLKWMTQLRADSVSSEILTLCRESGCVLISYGVESACNKILKSMKKQTTIEEITNALELTYQAKVGNKGNLIFGDREETAGTVRESLKWWRKNRKYQIQLSAIVVYPGCPSYYYAISKGLISDKKEFLVDIPELNLTKMKNVVLQNLYYHLAFLRYHTGMVGKVITCKKLREDSNKGVVYYLEVICPHCRKKNIYNNMNHQFVYHTQYGLYCKACRQKFRLLAFNIEMQIQKILDNKHYHNETFAIWNTNDSLFFPLATRLVKEAKHIIRAYPVEENVADHIIYPVGTLRDIIKVRSLRDLGVDLEVLYTMQTVEEAFDIFYFLAHDLQWSEMIKAMRELRDQTPHIFLQGRAIKLWEEGEGIVA